MAKFTIYNVRLVNDLSNAKTLQYQIWQNICIYMDYYMTSVIKSIQWWIWTYIIWTWIFNNYMYLFEIEDTWWTQNCRGLRIYINVHKGKQFIWLDILQTIGDQWTCHKAKSMQAMSIPLITVFYLNWKIN
jgi:hypothetical protein